MMDKFVKTSIIIAAVAILGFARTAVAQEQTEEEVQTRPNPEESPTSQSPVQPGTGTERQGIIVEEQPPQVNPATQDLERKGFNPQPYPPEKGAETMRKPDPTQNTNPATQDLERKGFNPQPYPPEKGAETMRKPDPTQNTQELKILKNNPNMKTMGR